jgi:ketosteroid isomerase-like protein
MASRAENIRDGFERWNRGDPSWVLEQMADDVEWIPPRMDPYSGTYRGREGVKEFWSRWRAAVGQLRFTVQEVVESGDDVLVIALRYAKSPETGLEVSDQIAQVFSFGPDGKCVRVREFHGREAAERAAGITRDRSS